jgi:hypothetical protein
MCSGPMVHGLSSSTKGKSHPYLLLLLHGTIVTRLILSFQIHILPHKDLRVEMETMERVKVNLLALLVSPSRAPIPLS